MALIGNPETATVAHVHSTTGARSRGASAPELLAKFVRVVIADDAGDLARVRAHDSHLLGEQLPTKVGCKFAEGELHRGAFAIRYYVRDLPARGRIRADDGAEIGDDFIGRPDQLPVRKGSKRGVIGQRRSQATGVARGDRGEELSSQLVRGRRTGVRGTFPFHT